MNENKGANMKIHVIEQDDKLIPIVLEGRLDTATVKDFETEFYAHTVAHKKSVLVDLSGLTFLSSMGIRMFLKAAKDLRAEGKKIILLNMQPLAEKALKSAGLDFLTPVAHDISQAKDMLKSS